MGLRLMKSWSSFPRGNNSSSSSSLKLEYLFSFFLFCICSSGSILLEIRLVHLCPTMLIVPGCFALLPSDGIISYESVLKTRNVSFSSTLKDFYSDLLNVSIYF